MHKTLLIDGQACDIESLEQQVDYVQFRYQGQDYRYRLRRRQHGEVVMERQHNDTVQLVHGYVGQPSTDGVSRLWIDGREVDVSDGSRRSKAVADDAPDEAVAPLTGVVRSVQVEVGQSVTKGSALVVMEAMKMQMTITAPRDGVISEVHVVEGEQVEEGTIVVDIETHS